MKSPITLHGTRHIASIERVGGKGIELFIGNDHVTAFRERANLLNQEKTTKTAFQLHQERARKAQ